jgi:hypothetical protein
MAAPNMAQAQAQAAACCIHPLLIEERVGVRSIPLPICFHPRPVPLPVKGEGKANWSGL